MSYRTVQHIYFKQYRWSQMSGQIFWVHKMEDAELLNFVRALSMVCGSNFYPDQNFGNVSGKY
jgi:hypothetical protein